MNGPLAAAWEVAQIPGSPWNLLCDYRRPGRAGMGECPPHGGADFTIATPLEGLADLVRLITGRFISRTSDAQDMARRTRMILIKAGNGVDVDISLALPGYEDDLIGDSHDTRKSHPQAALV